MSRSVSQYSISAFPSTQIQLPPCASEKPSGWEMGLEWKQDTALGFLPHPTHYRTPAEHDVLVSSPPPLATKQPLGRNDGRHSGVKRSSEPPANEQVYSRQCKINGNSLRFCWSQHELRPRGLFVANGVRKISKGSDPEDDRLWEILNWPERKTSKNRTRETEKLCNSLCPAIVALPTIAQH